jgi:hypothetical protein
VWKAAWSPSTGSGDANEAHPVTTEQGAPSRARGYVDGDEPCIVDQRAQRRASLSIDAAEILAAVGEVPYEWRIDSDVLLWGPNVADVLLIRDPDAIASGRRYAQFMPAENAQSRFDTGHGHAIGTAR